MFVGFFWQPNNRMILPPSRDGIPVWPRSRLRVSVCIRETPCSRLVPAPAKAFSKPAGTCACTTRRAVSVTFRSRRSSKGTWIFMIPAWHLHDLFPVSLPALDRCPVISPKPSAGTSPPSQAALRHGPPPWRGRSWAGPFAASVRWPCPWRPGRPSSLCLVVQASCWTPCARSWLADVGLSSVGALGRPRLPARPRRYASHRVRAGL